MSFPASICVFCGSQTGFNPVYADAAKQLGKRLAQLNCRLIFGGGHVGLMGAIADAVLAGGGEVTGVIPESLKQRELAHDGVADMRVVESMHARKALMAELSEGFVALPGGIGTFEELCEIMTWAQLKFHQKPIAILNVNGYYDSLIGMLEHGIREGFMRDAHRELYHVTTTVDGLIEFFTDATIGPSSRTAIWEKT